MAAHPTKWLHHDFNSGQRKTTTVRGPSLGLVLYDRQCPLVDVEHRDTIRTTLVVNLRLATRSQEPPKYEPARGSFSVQGVYYDKERDKYQAYVGTRRERIRLGRFESEIDAARAYDATAAKSLWRVRTAQLPLEQSMNNRKPPPQPPRCPRRLRRATPEQACASSSTLPGMVSRACRTRGQERGVANGPSRSPNEVPLSPTRPEDSKPSTGKFRSRLCPVVGLERNLVGDLDGHVATPRSCPLVSACTRTCPAGVLELAHGLLGRARRRRRGQRVSLGRAACRLFMIAQWEVERANSP